MTFLRFSGHWIKLSGLALCLFGGDIPEGGMEPLTIVEPQLFALPRPTWYFGLRAYSAGRAGSEGLYFHRKGVYTRL